MSIHNVEVYRCRACGEAVVTVPAGFSVSDEELHEKAVEHARQCSSSEYFERTQEEDAEGKVD